MERIASFITIVSFKDDNNDAAVVTDTAKDETCCVCMFALSALEHRPLGVCDRKRKAAGHGLVVFSVVSSPLGVACFKPLWVPTCPGKHCGKKGAWSKYSPLCQNANVMATRERDRLPADSSRASQWVSACEGRVAWGKEATWELQEGNRMAKELLDNVILMRCNGRSVIVN